MFTCGAPLQELHLAGKLADVYVKDISCEDPIECLHYAAKYPPICVYCACSMPEGDAAAEHHLQCSGCSQNSIYWNKNIYFFFVSKSFCTYICF